jgi:hypothetical protein
VFSPDVVADVADSAHDRLWHDRSRDLGVDAKLECLAQQPAVGAGRARDVCPSYVVTDGKQMVASTVKQIGGSRLTEHGCPFLDDCIPSSVQAPNTMAATKPNAITVALAATRNFTL